MLHILLLILKITGIIIAAILGILVLLICVVLFISGRYDIEASCDGRLSEIRAAAKVTWFLNLVRLYMCYEKNKMTWTLRIAWINRQSGQEDKKKIKEEVETYGEEMEGLWKDFEESVEEDSEEEQKVPGDSKEISKKNNETSDDTKAYEGLEETKTGIDKSLEETEAGTGEGMEETETGEVGAIEELEEAKIGKAGADEELEEAEVGETGSYEGLEKTEISEAGADEELEEGKQIWQRIMDICQKIVQRIKALYRKITGIPGKIEDMLKGISDQTGKLSDKKDKIIDFISDEVHKTALLKVRDESLYLLRKLKPKKILAQIHYGFEDPYLTGKVLAGISMIYPFLGKDIHVNPDFERQVLEGNMRITGRFRVSYFVRLLWKLIWCREVRMTYRHAKEFEL